MGQSTKDLDPESGHESIGHWTVILEQGVVTHEVLNYEYEGSGTEEDPYVVEWMESDPRNPMTWSPKTKWLITFCMGFAVLAVSFCSSAYSGGMNGNQRSFSRCSLTNRLQVFRRFSLTFIALKKSQLWESPFSWQDLL